MPASRTPEGFPSKCPLCGAETEIDYSATGGDAPCPNCGALLLRSEMLSHSLRSKLADVLGANIEQITPDFEFGELGADSLETVELVMELEEDMDIDIPDEELESCKSIRELVRLMLKYEKP